MARHLSTDMPILPLDRSLVAWWAGASLVGAMLWAAIGLGVCWFVGGC